MYTLTHALQKLRYRLSGLELEDTRSIAPEFPGQLNSLQLETDEWSFDYGGSDLIKEIEGRKPEKAPPPVPRGTSRSAWQNTLRLQPAEVVQSDADGVNGVRAYVRAPRVSDLDFG